MVARAIFGGGCFWCLEAVFNRLDGVQQVISGYAGGDTCDPCYEDVCSGETGHAEVVAIDFSPEVISYRQLLKVFFAIHDPTSLNRQGGDVGTQYRSVIFVESEQDREHAERFLAEVAKDHRLPVVTEIETLDVFYPAEDYHQRYFEAHPGQGYCAFVVAPKVQKARQSFAAWLKPEYR